MGRLRGGSGTRLVIRIELILLSALLCAIIGRKLTDGWNNAKRQEDRLRTTDTGEAIEVSAEGNYIKWVEFNVTSDAMTAAYELDVNSYQEDIHLNWIELLAYVGAKTGGRFDKNSVKKIKDVAGKLTNGESALEELTKDMEYYDYYLEAYTAVLGGMVGEYSIKEDGQWKHYYGLKAFLPIAKGFDYSHYDDFGSSRSYGYSRPHLGHDMMGLVGTPIGIKYRACASENDVQALII